MGTLYREPMGRLVLCYKKSKNLSGEAYIQSSNTNLPGITKTSQKIERLSKTRALALDDCIFASPEIFMDFLMSFIAKWQPLHRISVQSPPHITTIFIL